MKKSTPKKKTREKWLTRRCILCADLFTTSRSDACLCTPQCRQRQKRKRDKEFQAAATGKPAKLPRVRKGGAT